MRKIYLIPSILFLLYFLSCDGPFPSQSKPNVPADHNRNYNGVLHAGEGEGGGGKDAEDCNECHGSDLRGGIKQINGVWRYAPSCYQCHGNVWEGNNGGIEKLYFNRK
jgi:hypothetical protein